MQQLSLLLLNCCYVLLCSCVYYAQCSNQPCDRDTINAAADYTLYFVKQNFSDYVNIADVEQSFLLRSIRLQARNGRFGSVHSVTRVGDFDLVLSNEKSNNREKPTGRKMYSNLKVKFGNIQIEYQDSVIKFVPCSIRGSISAAAEHSLLEALAVSSDKKNCLMDFKQLKIHELGPIDVSINTAHDRFCASIASTAVNAFIKLFGEFARKIIKKQILDFFINNFPQTNSPMCVAPKFDVVFV